MKDLLIERVPGTEGGVVVLRLSGALDAHNFDEVDNTFQDLFADDMYKIVLDMEEVSYMSSAGVGTLVSSTMQCKENGGNLVLIKISDRLREVLGELGLIDILSHADDLQPALAKF